MMIIVRLIQFDSGRWYVRLNGKRVPVSPPAAAGDDEEWLFDPTTGRLVVSLADFARQFGRRVGGIPDGNRQVLGILAVEGERIRRRVRLVTGEYLPGDVSIAPPPLYGAPAIVEREESAPLADYLQAAGLTPATVGPRRVQLRAEFRLDVWEDAVPGRAYPWAGWRVNSATPVVRYVADHTYILAAPLAVEGGEIPAGTYTVTVPVEGDPMAQAEALPWAEYHEDDGSSYHDSGPGVGAQTYLAPHYRWGGND